VHGIEGLDDPEACMIKDFTAQSQIIHAAPNPGLEAGKPLSYEMILCRLAGWWTMSPNESSLEPLEIALLQLQ